MVKLSLSLSFTLALAFSSLTAQDCSKLMKKEKKGVISTKDQKLGSIIVQRYFIAFVKEDGKLWLEFYTAEGTSSMGALTDAAVEAGTVDSVRIDLLLTNREELSLRADNSKTSITPVSLRGAAVYHYYIEVSESELKSIASARAKSFRALKYQSKSSEKMDEKKWHTVNTSNGQDIMNAAKCFLKEI